MFFLRRIERGELLGRRFLLMFAFPLREWFAVDALARLIFAHVDAAFCRRFAIPVGQTIAAEAGKDHQIDVLHVGAFGIEMLEQAPECGRFQFGIAHGLFLANNFNPKDNAAFEPDTRNGR